MKSEKSLRGTQGTAESTRKTGRPIALLTTINWAIDSPSQGILSPSTETSDDLKG